VILTRKIFIDSRGQYIFLVNITPCISTQKSIFPVNITF